jgi:hypothetical protein
MVEYAGLIPLKPVDWGKVAQEAAKPITDVIENREQQRRDLEKDKTDSLSSLQKYEQNKAPNGAQFIMNASQEGRSYIMAQYELLTSGQITPEEYKRNTQNTRESFGMLNTYMKTYESDIQKAQERIDSGQAGAMERYLNDYRSQIMDLGGKVSNFGNNGTMYITGKDGRVYDLQSLNMGINKQPQKVDLVDEVDRSLKGLGIGAKSVNGVYTISNKLVGDWNKTKKGLKDAILNNPNKISSVLADNIGPGTYTFTTNPSEAGGNAILIEADPNGVMISKPTPEQRKIAEEAVDNFIESRIKIEGEKVDNTKSWALSLKQQELNLQKRKQDFEEKQASVPIQTRVNTIARMLETGDVGPIVGAGIQGLQARGEIVKDEDGKVVGDINKAYAGYDIFGIEPSKGGKGYDITLSAKQTDEKTGKESIVKKKVYMSTSGVITSFNNALSSTANSDEYKGINPEQILPYFEGVTTTKRQAQQTGTVQGGSVR